MTEDKIPAEVMNEGNAWQELSRFSVYPRLKELAKIPYDLSRPGAITPERIGRYIAGAAGLDLLFAFEQVDAEVLDAFQDLADESRAVDQFMMMKTGAVMNRIKGFACENRQVLHTATRDIFHQPPCNPSATNEAREQLARLMEFLDELGKGTILNERAEPFTDMIQIGIGGSDLGPRALYFALEAYRNPSRRVHFISNVDPDDAAAVLRRVDLSRTLVNVVSKSGTTLETLTNEELVRAAFDRAGLDPNRHFIAVTGKGSPMDNPGRYLRSFHMYDYIGGRYSATSMVGAVMLAFSLGYKAFLQILRGANDMDRAAEEREIRKNPALLLALLGIWNRNFLLHETLAILPYSQALHRFTAHLQQCDMESNGKSVTRNGERVTGHTGPIIWGEPGTNGQHAFYQLIHQGTTKVPVEFIGFRRPQYGEDIRIQGTSSQEKLLANLLAQSLALATGQANDNPNCFFPGNRPNAIITADQLSPYAMGSLLALYEAKIVFQGFIWNINSFDQEGVQLGKKLATKMMGHFAGQREGQDVTGGKDALDISLMKAAGILGTRESCEKDDHGCDGAYCTESRSRSESGACTGKSHNRCCA